MNPDTRENMDKRMRRISGQVAGIQRMMEDDRYCVDILNQISAVRAALDALGVELLTGHVESCILGRPCGKEHPEAKAMKPTELITELRAVLSRFLK